jgi:hypothetical protein
MNRPGYSWGPNAPVNLLKLDKGVWVAVFYNIDPPQIIKIFHPANLGEEYQMFDRLAEWNYHTCRLCDEVRIALDWQN